MNIEIIGNKSSNQIKLIKNIKKVLDELKLNINVLEIEKTKKYSIKNTPALIINDDLICEGKVLKEREIIKYIKRYTTV